MTLQRLKFPLALENVNVINIVTKLTKSSIFTCNLISQSCNILLLGLVLYNQTKRKFRVKAWTELSKESLGVFLVYYKDISMPKNVWNPWVLSVLARAKVDTVVDKRNNVSCNVDGPTVATSKRKNSEARNWNQNSQKPMNLELSLHRQRGYQREICIQSSSFHWLPDMMSCPSPPPLLVNLAKTDQRALKAPRLNALVSTGEIK